MTVPPNTSGSPGDPERAEGPTDPTGTTHRGQPGDPERAGTTAAEDRPAIGRRDWLRIGLAMFAIGFGANLFAPMLEVYRSLEGIGQASVTAMLGIYAAGLVPALLIFGPVSDRRGRRAVLRPALFLSGVGTVILAAGSFGAEWPLYLGRWVVGASVGMAMACGAAWIKQLSVDRPTAGPRRATIAVSAGFGGGPFVSGLLAEFLPGPEVTPYVAQLLLLAVVIPVMWSTPETQFARATGGDGGVVKRTLVPPVALTRTFLWAVAAWAPWVFGTVTVAFASLPTFVIHRVDHPIAYIGMVAATAMISGVLIQPTAARVAEKGWLPLSVLGLGTACAGMLLGAATAWVGHPAMVFPASLLLGFSYGIMMVSGLREVEIIAGPDDLGALIGVFYALTYIGFFVPFVLSLAGPALAGVLGVDDVTGFIVLLLVGAVVCVASMVPVGRAAENGLALARRGRR